MRRLLVMMALACLSLSISCGSGKNAALQHSEQVTPVPGGWRVNLAGLAEMKRDCGFVESPTDDPIQPTENPAEVIATDGYMAKLTLACER